MCFSFPSWEFQNLFLQKKKSPVHYHTGTGRTVLHCLSNCERPWIYHTSEHALRVLDSQEVHKLKTHLVFNCENLSNLTVWGTGFGRGKMNITSMGNHWVQDDFFSFLCISLIDIDILFLTELGQLCINTNYCETSSFHITQYYDRTWHL